MRHNSVLTHCRFVRVNSLLPEVSIQVRAGMHYFITLHGKVDIRAYGVRGNDSSVRVPVYPSGLVTNRPADIRQKLWTSAKVFIINAFRSTRPILLRLVRKDFRVKLNYSEVKLFENVTIEEGDCFILLNRKDKYNPRGKDSFLLHCLIFGVGCDGRLHAAFVSLLCPYLFADQPPNLYELSHGMLRAWTG